MGQFYWIDAAAPLLAGAFPTYQRAVMALDTGGAIKGAIRADLYTGRGDAAGQEAGRVRHELRMYRLIPVDDQVR
jgi:membrane-bound lytic murein transglycosylase A